MSKKFRPQNDSKKWMLKQHLAGDYTNYNWVERCNYGPVKFGYFFAHIHYLASHAPAAIQKRYAGANKIWWQKMAWWKSGASRKL